MMSLDRNKNLISYNSNTSVGGDSNGGSDRSRCNLIVNYLPQSLKEDQFHQLFEQIGPIRQSKLMHNKQTGDSFGYGFVDYQNPDDAVKAIDTYNGYQIENKRLKVAYAKQHDNNGGAVEDNTKTSTNLYVSNLPLTYDEQNLNELFAQYGDVTSTRVLRDQNSQQSRGIGFVIMQTNQQAQQAINALDNVVPQNATESLHVKFANDNGKRRQQQQQQRYDGYNNNNNNNSFNNPVKNGFFDNFQTAPQPHHHQQHHQNSFNSHQGGYNNKPKPNYNNYGRSPMHTNHYDGGYNGGAPKMDTFDSYGMDVQGGGGGLGGGLGGGQDSSNIIYVYGIGPHTTESDLFTLFTNAGRVSRVNVIKNQQSGIGKGYGFVIFETYEEACNAVRTVNGYMFNNRPLQVSLKK